MSVHLSFPSLFDSTLTLCRVSSITVTRDTCVNAQSSRIFAPSSFSATSGSRSRIFRLDTAHWDAKVPRHESEIRSGFRRNYWCGWGGAERGNRATVSVDCIETDEHSILLVAIVLESRRPKIASYYASLLSLILQKVHCAANANYPHQSRQ